MAVVLGSLTTQFTPPAACASVVTNIYNSPGNGVFAGPLTPGNCFPSSYNPTASTYYYSPAHLCPVGYGPACSSVAPVINQGESETRITCCPTYEILAIFCSTYCGKSNGMLTHRKPCPIHMQPISYILVGVHASLPAGDCARRCVACIHRRLDERCGRDGYRGRQQWRWNSSGRPSCERIRHPD